MSAVQAWVVLSSGCSLAELVGKTKKQNISRPGLCARVYCQAAVGLCFLVRTILTGEQIYFELTKVSYCSKFCPFHLSRFQVIRKDCFNKKNSFYFFQDRRGYVSYYVAQAVLKLLGSRDPPASVLWVAGNSDVWQWTLLSSQHLSCGPGLSPSHPECLT